MGLFCPRSLWRREAGMAEGRLAKGSGAEQGFTRGQEGAWPPFTLSPCWAKAASHIVSTKARVMRPHRRLGEKQCRWKAPTPKSTRHLWDREGPPDRALGFGKGGSSCHSNHLLALQLGNLLSSQCWSLQQFYEVKHRSERTGGAEPGLSVAWASEATTTQFCGFRAWAGRSPVVAPGACPVQSCTGTDEPHRDTWCAWA